ncbi:Transmembrane protein [Parasponia andersonii]|uniref:Transmembrane protein n=1 Tax=Parasponia andersonii TaxID=3476 RepID=A0A2P5CH44_PARAD|nr:Transmembrane protein [Parasponia andersonii]
MVSPPQKSEESTPNDPNISDASEVWPGAGSETPPLAPVQTDNEEKKIVDQDQSSEEILKSTTDPHHEKSDIQSLIPQFEELSTHSAQASSSNQEAAKSNIDPIIALYGSLATPKPKPDENPGPYKDFLVFTWEIVGLEPIPPNMDSDGNTPLHIAALACRHVLVDNLLNVLNNLQQKEFVRVVNAKGETALHKAILARSLALVIKLIEYDGQLGLITNNMDESPLFLAADQKNYLIVGRLLFLKEIQANPISDRGRNGQTALHASVLGSSGESFALGLLFAPTIGDKLELKAVRDGSASYAALERKAELYEKLMRGELSDEEDKEKYYVDFFAKRVEEDELQKLQYLDSSDAIPPGNEDGDNDDSVLFNMKPMGLGPVSSTMDDNEHKRKCIKKQTKQEKKASELKLRRQEQAAARREKLIQDFLRKQLEKLKVASSTEKT